MDTARVVRFALAAAALGTSALVSGCYGDGYYAARPAYYARPAVAVGYQQPYYNSGYSNGYSNAGYYQQAGYQPAGYYRQAGYGGGYSGYNAQPAYAQPAYAQPAYAQPAYAQPSYARPAYVQPAYAQPARPAYVAPSGGYARPAFAGGGGVFVR